MKNLANLFQTAGWRELKKHIKETKIVELEEIILNKENSPTIEQVDEARNKREAFLFLLDIESELWQKSKEIDFEL